MAKKGKKIEEIIDQDEVATTDTMKPEVIEPVKNNGLDEFNLKFGECVIQIVAEGASKGKLFKTTLKMAEKRFSNPERYTIVKKN